MQESHSEMAAKRASEKTKSPRVFGQARKPAKMFRAGLYARVSCSDQQTIPLQIRALREYAARRGWAIALEVKEAVAVHPNGNCGRSCWRRRAAARST
jgi:hypothetical protein